MSANRANIGEPPAWWTKDEWATPLGLFQSLSAKHGPFDLDVCARAESAKVELFYDKGIDALAQDWCANDTDHQDIPFKAWCNPPYSDPSPWCRKAVEQTQKFPNLTVVMLLPAGVDTAWFHDSVVPFADWYPLRGRPKFLLWDGLPKGTPKSGCIVAVFPKGRV